MRLERVAGRFSSSAGMTRLKMLTADDKLAEIRHLYFRATKETIQRDLERALDILKSMDGEDERERATVYMLFRYTSGSRNLRFCCGPRR